MITDSSLLQRCAQPFDRKQIIFHELAHNGARGLNAVHQSNSLAHKRGCKLFGTLVSAFRELGDFGQRRFAHQRLQTAVSQSKNRKPEALIFRSVRLFAPFGQACAYSASRLNLRLQLHIPVKHDRRFTADRERSGFHRYLEGRVMVPSQVSTFSCSAPSSGNQVCVTFLLSVKKMNPSRPIM